MKIVRFEASGTASGARAPRWGELDGALVHPLSGAPWDGAVRTGEAPLALDAVALLAPCVPGKVLGIGRNYRAHAAELGNEVPKEPLVFVKAATSVIGPGGTVLLPKESERTDYEGELAVVIGRRARRLAAEDWRDVVLGFTCALDVTARDLQKKDGQWWRAKGFDTFCPLGPVIETDLDPADLVLETFVDGALVQAAKTSSMIFDVGTLVAHVSSAMTLEPGDVILTGTPEGVGPLAPGQRVEVTIEGIGSLSVSVASEPA